MEVCHAERLIQVRNKTSLSPLVYMEINFSSILGTELIIVLIQTLFFLSHFVRIKIFFTWKTNMTNIHLRTWMMNTREALQGCLCWYVEVTLKRDLSCAPVLFLTCSFPSTPPMKLFIFWHDCRKHRSLQTTADIKGKANEVREKNKTSKLSGFFPTHAKLSLVNKVV